MTQYMVSKSDVINDGL